MARAALILSVLIASPGDVSKERETVVEAIAEWNATHSKRTKISLEPVRWETHSYPASGERPQGIINRQIVDDCDFVIGIFGLRLGTPTGEAQSGTIEEIERFRQRGRHVALYFSTAPLPRDHDHEQLTALNKYHDARKADSLCGGFSTPEELKQQVTRHLPSIVEEVHKKLSTSGELKEVEKELEDAQITVSRDLKQLAEDERAALGPFIPPKIEIEVENQFPEGPSLRVTSNKDLEVNRIDYVDDHDVKLFTLKYFLHGRSVQVPILHTHLTDIRNRRGGDYHLKFRLTMTVAGETITGTLPAFIEQRVRNSTYYMHVSG